MDPTLGQIDLFAFDYAPSEYLLCSGTILQVQQNTALFSLLGPHYGGDGRTTFALPNMLGLEPIPGMRYYIAAQGIYPQRQ